MTDGDTYYKTIQFAAKNPDLDDLACRIILYLISKTILESSEIQEYKPCDINDFLTETEISRIEFDNAIKMLSKFDVIEIHQKADGTEDVSLKTMNINQCL